MELLEEVGYASQNTEKSVIESQVLLLRDNQDQSVLSHFQTNVLIQIEMKLHRHRLIKLSYKWESCIMAAVFIANLEVIFLGP